MIKRISLMVAAALMVATIAMTTLGVGVSGAKVGCTTTFEKGETTETCVRGSHGTTDSHQGAPNSSGKDRGGGPCKATGSEETNTC